MLHAILFLPLRIIRDYMGENKGYMQRYAMLFGTYMGIFWILKFILVPIGITVPFLLFSFLCLTLCVPFLGYYYTKMYRIRACNGYIGFLHAWAFNIFMFICASLLTFVAHYIYFSFIDHGYLIGVCEDMLQTLKANDIPGTETYIEQMGNSINILSSLTPTDICLQMLVNNIYNCSLLSIPIALFAMRRNKQPASNQ